MKELQAHVRQQAADSAAAAAAPTAAVARADPWFGKILGGGGRDGAPAHDDEPRPMALVR